MYLYIDFMDEFKEVGPGRVESGLGKIWSTLRNLLAQSYTNTSVRMAIQVQPRILRVFLDGAIPSGACLLRRNFNP